MSTSYSTLTPLQLTAGAGLMENEGLTVSANLILSIDSYDTLLPVGNVILLGASATGNVGNSNVQIPILSNVTIRALESMGANSCPTLGDSLPVAYANAFGNSNVQGFTNFLEGTANSYLPADDLTIFAQLFAQSQSYYQLTNQFINSTVNSQTYLANTFTNTNNMVTGEITSVNVCTPEFARDLANLGSLINLRNLNELGTPSALVKQLALLGGVSSTLAITFAAHGVNLDTVLALNDQNLTVSNADQKAMYTAMMNITNENGKLSEILQVFGIRNSLPPSVVGPASAYTNQTVTIYITGGVPKTSFNWLSRSTNPSGAVSAGYIFDSSGSCSFTISESIAGTYNWDWTFISSNFSGIYTIDMLPINSLPAPPPPPGKPMPAAGQTALNINSMADLLNPYILFPNSFQTLTVTDINNVSQNIYIDANGTVNSTLLRVLPPTVLRSTA
jgi:hypothetical protein